MPPVSSALFRFRLLQLRLLRPRQLRLRLLRGPILGTAALCMLLLSGCNLMPSRSGGSLELDFAQVLPTGWDAVGDWREVNIDDDEAVEYLLLFRYDNGPIGAVIYDSQVAAEVVGMVDVSATPVPTATVELVPVPLQSFGYFKPYRLLPSYWAYTYGSRTSHNMGQGYVAPPGAAEEITVHSMARPAGTGSESTQPARELVLRGGNTHLTFVWWKGRLEGYGVTQLYAGAGFDGVDWEAWVDNPTPILEISGLEPLHDYRARSQICREMAYRRVGMDEDGRAPQGAAPQGEEAGESTLDLGSAAAASDSAVTATERMTTAADSAIVFAATDRGLRFCTDMPPSHPFYPEGVVLTYLRQLRSEDAPVVTLLSPGSSTAQVEAAGDLGRLDVERIEDIATYPSIPVRPANLAAGEFAPSTSVCVELVSVNEPSLQRWLVFTLRYQPPDLAQKLPDRWTVTGVQPEPQPVSPPGEPYCNTVLGRVMP